MTGPNLVLTQTWKSAFPSSDYLRHPKHSVLFLLQTENMSEWCIPQDSSQCCDAFVWREGCIMSIWIRPSLVQVLTLSHSAVSNSLWLDGLQSTRLLHECSFPGKNTGVSCHFLLQGIGEDSLNNGWAAELNSHMFTLAAIATPHS